MLQLGAQAQPRQGLRLPQLRQRVHQRMGAACFAALLRQPGQHNVAGDDLVWCAHFGDQRQVGLQQALGFGQIVTGIQGFAQKRRGDGAARHMLARVLGGRRPRCPRAACALPYRPMSAS